MPYTEDRLVELARSGTRRLVACCPGFAVDCLETLEEIAIRGRETFLAAGGESFEYVACLNDGAAQTESLARLAARALGTAA
jgi:ferrochelatase